MAKLDIARALKDKSYFNSLSDAEKAQVQAANPAGNVELQDDELDSVSGGIGGSAAQIETTTTTNGSCSCTSGFGTEDCACGCQKEADISPN